MKNSSRLKTHNNLLPQNLILESLGWRNIANGRSAPTFRVLHCRRFNHHQSFSLVSFASSYFSLNGSLRKIRWYFYSLQFWITFPGKNGRKQQQQQPPSKSTALFPPTFHLLSKEESNSPNQIKLVILLKNKKREQLFFLPSKLPNLTTILPRRFLHY